MKIRLFRVAVALLLAAGLAGCTANTSLLCALANYLPFNFSACAPTPTPAATPTK